MTQLEFDYYAPPDVPIDSTGKITDFTNVYNFNNKDQLFLLSFSGWGMPPIEYITQRAPFQHGQTALDYRLQPRVIQLMHRRIGNCRNDYWNNRGDLMNLIRPNRQAANSFEPGRLRKVLPDGSIRDLFVYLQQGPVFAPRQQGVWDEYSFTETIRFIAYNPIAFDPATESAIWALTDVGNLIFFEAVNWTDRMVVPFWFGASSLSETLSITYTGTWEAFPTIIITGPLEIPRIVNITTDEKIELNYNVAVGETVTINLQFGNKTVVNNFGTNLIGTVTSDSDLATFHIAPDPEATGGVNQLQVVGGGAVIGNTEVRIEWNTQYIGI